MKLRENFPTQLFEEISHGDEVRHAALDGACFRLATGISIAVAAHTYTHTRWRATCYIMSFIN